MESADSGATSGDPTLDAAIDQFLESGNKAGNYEAALERVLTDWRSYLESRGVETVGGVTKRHMAAYAMALSNDEERSAATARTYYDYVSAFLSYCVKWEWLEENPARKGVALDELPPRPKKKSGDQQFWSADDRKALLDYVDRRAHRAVDETGTDALTELRDRALVYVLAYSGARSGEILRDPRDERRNGICWGDVDLENNQLLVLGKNQQRDEEVQLPDQAHPPLERLERALEPPSPEWPVFVTSHAPSLYTNLPDDVDTSTGEPIELHREHGVKPPSLSTNGARSVLKRLCEDADLEVDGEYLKPHGARRGVGEAIFREKGAAAAQRVLRHADPRTTSRMYAHIETEELAEEATEVFDNEQ